ncbi:MAG TPA: CapA family protein [Nitrospiraceae bacterium]|nr:CapA family protein [Nitrospiraceae bacterium]
MRHMTLALTGDVMLGRLVDESIIRNPTLPPETVWGDMRPRLLEADLRLINLECVISDRGREWKPDSKAFHFRSDPRAIEVLRAAKIDGVTLANNHALDYGAEALRDCLERLDAAGIQHTGAGATLAQALEPMYLATSSGTVAVIGLTDNEPEWEATDRTAGVHVIRYGINGLVEPYRERLSRLIRSARQRAQLVVVGAHVGPNWGSPSRAMQALARDLIDLGADLYWGHSNHTPQGIELYRGRAILYSTGDFVDDYAVDPAERNDLTFLFVTELEQGRVAQIRLVPVAIDEFRVRLAKGAERTFLERTMERKCAALGTAVRWRQGEGTILV